MRRGRVDLYPDYEGSLVRYLARPSTGLRRALSRIGAVPLRRARAQNRNVFVMKTDTAQRLGVTKISDLGKYWPAT